MMTDMRVATISAANSWILTSVGDFMLMRPVGGDKIESKRY